MIKMDAGCELHGYCSDVTRCWPVSGTFSPPQRALYEAVLEINRRRPLPPARPLWDAVRISDRHCGSNHRSVVIWQADHRPLRRTSYFDGWYHLSLACVRKPHIF